MRTTGSTLPAAAPLAAGLAAGLTAAPAAAQLDMLQPPPSLPSLPDPPPLQHALLENPIPLVIAAVALGLAAYALASRAGRRRLGLALAAGAAVLGAAAIALSLAVRTDRERLIAHSRDLVGAVAAADIAALDQLLAPDARLVARGAGAGFDKRYVLAWIDTYLAPGSRYAVESHRTTDVQAEIGVNQRTARTRASTIVTPAERSPTRFICMLHWRRDTGGPWQLVEIEPLWLQGWGEVNAGDLRRNSLP